MSRMQHQQNCWCHPAEDCDPPVEGDAPCSHVNPECEALQIAHERLVEALRDARQTLAVAIRANVQIPDFDAVSEHITIRKIDAALASLESK